MGQLQNKYHISDDGKIFQVQDDGTIEEKGQLDELLTKSSSRTSSRVFFSHNWSWIAVLICILLNLIIVATGEERFYRYDFARSVHVFFFDSICWVYLLVTAFVCATWIMSIKHFKQKLLLYIIYGVGMLFLANNDYYFNWAFWGDIAILIFYIKWLLPLLICILWAYALRNSQKINNENGTTT